MNQWPVIILGGTGYVAGEMLRLVTQHPRLELAASVSTSREAQPIRNTFEHLAPAIGDTPFTGFDGAFAALEAAEHSVLLSAAPHGESAEIIGRMLDHAAAAGVKLTVVDASADFRFADPNAWAKVYGKAHPRPDLLEQFICAVPEHARDTDAAHAAQPGCFATTMLLGIVPLLAANIARPVFQASAVTGSTGAGRKPRETTHHPVRQSNMFAYQPLAHRHQPEVEALTLAATGQSLDLKFVPHSGPFARGIHATLFAELETGATTEEVLTALRNYYADSPFVRVSDELPKIKDVAGSCHATVSARVDGNTVVVCSVLDNLVKGAAGGCVQWLNRLLELPEDTGLAAPAPGWL